MTRYVTCPVCRRCESSLERIVSNLTCTNSPTDYSTQSAPASVQLESFTPGGLGPLHSATLEKSKELPLARRVWNGATQPCRTLCCSTRTTQQYDGETHYLDTFNDQSWSCSIGTTDESGIWLNRADPAGTVMAFFVWVLLAYSILTVTLLAATAGIPTLLSMTYTVLACCALACHAKTQLTDPGSVPLSAVPTAHQRQTQSKLSMCSQCQTFKPPASHHCRICNRCISRMDHHWYVSTHVWCNGRLKRCMDCSTLLFLPNKTVPG